MSPLRSDSSKARVRVVPTGAGQWVAVAITAQGRHVSRSPQGRQDQAEEYGRNYVRFGAWKRS